MKVVFPLVVTACCLLAGGLVHAQSAFGPDINGAGDNDPDEPQQTQRQYTREQIATIQAMQARQAEDRDWLMQNFQKVQASNSTDGGPTDLYYQIGTNRELAKLAGITPLNIDLPQSSSSSSSYRTGTTSGGRMSLSLRSDPGDGSQPRRAASPGFRPLLTPGSFLNTFSSGTYGGTSAPAKPKPAPAKDPDLDRSALDMPGLTAAEHDPLKNADLKFDLSSMGDNPPGKTVSAAGVLPPSTEMDRLRLQNAQALKKPDGTDPQQLPVVKAVNPKKVETPPDLVPAKVIEVSPVRQPIGDVHDIFYR